MECGVDHLRKIWSTKPAEASPCRSDEGSRSGPNTAPRQGDGHRPQRRHEHSSGWSDAVGTARTRAAEGPPHGLSRNQNAHPGSGGAARRELRQLWSKERR